MGSITLYHDKMNARFGSALELVREQMAQTNFSSHSIEEGYESDGESVDSDVNGDRMEGKGGVFGVVS
jgi:hypothetical protein